MSELKINDIIFIRASKGRFISHTSNGKVIIPSNINKLKVGYAKIESIESVDNNYYIAKMANVEYDLYSTVTISEMLNIAQKFGYELKYRKGVDKTIQFIFSNRASGDILVCEKISKLWRWSRIDVYTMRQPFPDMKVTRGKGTHIRIPMDIMYNDFKYKGFLSTIETLKYEYASEVCGVRLDKAVCNLDKDKCLIINKENTSWKQFRACELFRPEEVINDQ